MRIAIVLCLMALLSPDVGAAIQNSSSSPRNILQAGSLRPFAISSDGRWLAATSGGFVTSPEISIIDLVAGRKVRTYPVERVIGGVFSPDSRFLAVSEGRHGIAIIDIERNARSASLEIASAGHIAFVDATTIAVSTREKTVEFWNIATNQKSPESIALRSNATAIACSLDGSTIAVACLESDPKPDSGLERGPATIRVWAIAGLRELTSLAGHTNEIRTMAFHPRGRQLAAAGFEKTIRIWDLETSKQVKVLSGHEQFVNAVAFTPNGAELLSISLGIRVSDSPSGHKFEQYRWTVATGQLKQSLAGPEHVDTVVDPQGRFIARHVDGRIEVARSTDDRKASMKMDQLDGCFFVAFAPSGRNLVVNTSSSGAQLWDLQNGRRIRSFESKGVGPAFVSPDGSRALIGGMTSKVVVLDSGEEQVTGLPGAAFEFMTDPATGSQLAGNGTIAVGPDGTTAAFTATKTGAVVLKDLATGADRLVVEGRDVVGSAIAFSPDGTSIALGTIPADQSSRRMRKTTADGVLLDVKCEVAIWDAATGREIRVLGRHTDKVSAVAFSPDGKLVASASHDQTAKVWELATGRLVLSLATRVAGFNSVVFSPDGSTLATCANNTIQLWAVSTGRLLHSLDGHTAVVSSVAFHPGGKFLASSSPDGTVALWDVSGGERVATISSVSNGVDWVVQTPDGLFDGTPGGWSKIVWRFSDRTDDVAPVEAYFSDFFSPGLLADIFAGKRPKAASTIASKDRRLPKVRLSVDVATTAPSPTARSVDLRIDVENATGQDDPAGAPGARDVRLFHNGTLVKAWRGEVIEPGRPSTVLRTRAPIVEGENRFVAYAFNRDNVKSEDATAVIVGPPDLARKGTAYILTIGVSRYANTAFDLRYAASDAVAFGNALRDNLEGLDEYGSVELVPLLDRDATRTRILAELTRLGASAKLSIRPEDAVIVFFAGHGLASGDRYFLVPHDLGYNGTREAFGPGHERRVFDHSISDRELELALENIHAGRIVLVIDACYSGKALDANETRLGPMNSRGLAQLAYEKGMFVLTASQAREQALESSTIRHGFLTYALIEEGLKTAAADTAPTDGKLEVREWFGFAERRVPQLVSGSVGAERDIEHSSPAEASTQRPRLFYRVDLAGSAWIMTTFGARAAPTQPD